MYSRRIKPFRSILIGTALLTTVHACDLNTIEPPSSVVPPVVIGVSGGTVEVRDGSSAIRGAKIIIPPGALYEDTLITIEQVDQPADLPEPYQAAGPPVAFGTEGITFNVPVEIYLPYFDTDQNGLVDGTAIPESKTAFFYFNELTRQWETLTVTGRDTAKNILSAETGHFSTYLVPIDASGSATSGGTAGGGEQLEIGEYFVGDNRYEFDENGNAHVIEYGCLEQDRTQCLAQGNCRPCGTSYVLSLRPEVSDTGPILVGVIDRFTTLSGGYPVVLDPNGEYATFDISDESDYFPFAKLQRSGNAEAWEWACEYVVERTVLRDYESCEENDPKTLCNESAERIYCDISASGTEVRIEFGIDLSEEQNNGIPEPNFTIGDFGILAIAFEARYIGE